MEWCWLIVFVAAVERKTKVRKGMDLTKHDAPRIRSHSGPITHLPDH
jgi:hypothetical protein